MEAPLIVLFALIPVLFIGACLIETLLWAAPRRGKRPDIHTCDPVGRVQVRVMDPDGRVLRGTPRTVAYRLLLAGWGNPFRYLSGRDADRLLRLWEEERRIRVRAEWGT